ncbi:MAG: fumarylacetoacetate hydrolase family protein [Dehalococcoidia bacterium]|nr:fumarylacetoacetate hydrolase family protein [Dehalococcoidia bacterium]
MKIVRYSLHTKVHYGILEGERIQIIAGTPFRGMKKTNEWVKLSEVALLAPCVPSKVLAIGASYRSHCLEMGQPILEEPMVFFKPSTSVVGPEANLVRPAGVKRFDYEGEVGVVIKRRAHKVRRANALDYVLGYTCVNDVSVRDWQNVAANWQWARAKGGDTYCPIGPCIETQADPLDVWVETRLNGERKQRISTSDLIWDIPEMIRYLTETITLLPGDVIATGTPSGIGPMKAGDVVEISVDGVGTLRNYVTQG